MFGSSCFENLDGGVEERHALDGLIGFVRGIDSVLVFFVLTAWNELRSLIFWDDLDGSDFGRFGFLASLGLFLSGLLLVCFWLCGFLLGIGQGERSDTLKLEIYTEGETGVESYCKLELPYTNYYPDYKCYYIDRENGLIGIGIHTWDKIELDEYHAYHYDNYRFGSVVFRFDGESISEVLRVEYGRDGNMQQMRGVYIDGYYYIFHKHHFNVSALPLE